MCRDLRVLDSTAIQAKDAALDLEHRMIMIRAVLANQQLHQALPQAKPLDFIGVPDLGETVRWGDVARSALECGARHEAPLCRCAALAKAKPFSDRPAHGPSARQDGKRAAVKG